MPLPQCSLKATTYQASCVVLHQRVTFCMGHHYVASMCSITSCYWGQALGFLSRTLSLLFLHQANMTHFHPLWSVLQSSHITWCLNFLSNNNGKKMAPGPEVSHQGWGLYWACIWSLSSDQTGNEFREGVHIHTVPFSSLENPFLKARNKDLWWFSSIWSAAVR